MRPAPLAGPLAALSFASCLSAQTPYLVRDINTQPSNLGSTPRLDRHGAGPSIAAFRADDGIHGNEPWITDGTPEGTRHIGDLFRGNPYITTEVLGYAGDTIIFSVTDETPPFNGPVMQSVWASPPPYVSATHLADVAPLFISDPTPSNWKAAPLDDGRLVFVASTPATGAELWVTDGTPANTRLVTGVYPDATSGARYPFSRGDYVLFAGAGPGLGTELWRSDGTPEGTVMVRNIAAGIASSNPQSFVEFNGYTYFTCADSDTIFGQNIWRTDGTPEGTTRVHQLNSGAAAMTTVQGMTALGNKLYFYGNFGSGQKFFSVSDGTPAGLTQLAPFNISFSDPSPIAHRDGWTYFLGSDAAHGSEVWRTDGTLANTALAWDRVPGPQPGVIRALHATPEALIVDYFYGLAALASDLSVTPLAEMPLVFPLFRPEGWMLFQDRLYFTFSDPEHGLELWTSDGTPDGTHLFKDIRAAQANGNADLAYATPLDQTRATILFSATDGLHGNEPWRSDGTQAGTSLIRDINPGPASSEIDATYRWGSAVYFRANDGVHGKEIWSTRGDDASTSMLADLYTGTGIPWYTNDGPVFAVVGDYLLFQGAGASGTELWRTQGTPLTTAPLIDFSPGSGSSRPINLLRAGGFVYGQLVNESNGTVGMVRTNGVSTQTVSTTVQYAQPMQAVTAGVVFTSGNLSGGEEISFIAHAGATSIRLRDIRPGTEGSAPRSLTAFQNMVFFSADESVSASTGSGRELWRTDGTPADTVLFADLNPGRGSSNPADLAATDHLLFFTAITPAAGRELWVTDGTSAGTHLVLDINPGPDSASPYNLTPVGPSRIVFAAYDPDHGTELWESDGTPAGTHRLTDVFPGPEPSSPSQIIAMRDLVFFEANDGVHGREPWAIALSTNLCACDWDDSGLLNTADFFAFLTDFFAAAPAADFNNDGFVNSSDFFEFLSCFFAGCES